MVVQLSTSYLRDTEESDSEDDPSSETAKNFGIAMSASRAAAYTCKAACDLTLQASLIDAKMLEACNKMPDAERGVSIHDRHRGACHDMAKLSRIKGASCLYG